VPGGGLLAYIIAVITITFPLAHIILLHYHSPKCAKSVLKMASIKKIGEKYRVQIRRINAPYQSAYFNSKREAQQWAADHEFKASRGLRRTLWQAFDRYLDTVTPQHRGKRWEALRIAAFKRQLPDRLLAVVSSDTIAQWRDARLEVVSTGTVRREMNLLGAIFSTAVREWGWIETNPFVRVKRPPDGAAKDRVITSDEVRMFVAACTSPVQKRVAAAFLFALETGMRAGEICGIKGEHISGSYVKLPKTKNGDERTVPLSKRARSLLPKEGLNITSAQLDVHFRKTRDKLNFDFTFHATRHTAATRIGHSGILSPFELCAMFGWRNPKMALRYVKSDIQSIADRL